MDEKPDNALNTAPGNAHAGGCTCAKLRRLARRVTQSYDHVLHATGLKVTQYSLLVNLRENSALSVSALAETMAMDRTTLTRNLKPLVQGGLVSVQDGPNRRTRTVVITAAGEEILGRSIPYWKRAQQDLVNALGEDMVQELHLLLDESMKKLATA